VLPDGRVRIRRQRQQGPISGDLASTAADAVKLLTEKATIAQGSGPAKGRFSVTACHASLGCGTFEGRFEGRNTAQGFAGEFKGRGTRGDFDEARFSGSFTETTPTSNVFAITGTIQADDEDDDADDDEDDGEDDEDEDEDDDGPPPPPPPPPVPSCVGPALPPGGTTGISGRVFDAASGSGLAGWCVEIFGPSGSLIAATQTGATGDYAFTGLPAGTHTVCEVVQSGWTQTSPRNPAACASGFGYTFELLAGENALFVNFGNMRL
jgi:hypothetical protein